MSKRAEAVEQTRRRILDAALAEYAERGIDGTSMQGVARRADVATGTVLNHFATPEVLAEAVIEDRVATLAMPTAASIDASSPVAERIRTLTEELFRVFRDTDLEYRTYVRSRRNPVMTRYERWYAGVYADALAAALGPLAGDPRVGQVVSAVIDPGFRGSLLARGLTHEQAVDEAVRLALGWLDSYATAPTT